jgi:hypothetical protein
MSTKRAEKFGQAEESRLVSCLDRATSLVSGGSPPSEAIAKAAKEARLHPDSVPLAVHAYNVGRQTYQRQKCAGKDTSCLLGEFPLADPDDVESIMYPKSSSILEGRKAASMSVVSDEYSQAPSQMAKYRKAAMEKIASERLPAPKVESKPEDPQLYYHRCAQVKLAADKAVRDLEISLINSQDELRSKLAAVWDWCRKNSSQVPVVEWNSRQLFGDGVKEIFDYATSGLTGIGRAQKRAYTSKSAVDQGSAPYSLVKSALDKAVELIQDSASVRRAQEKIAQGVATTLPFGPKEEETSFVLKRASSIKKDAAGFFGGMLSGGIGGAISHALTPKDPSDISDNMQTAIADPSHEARMRSIRAQAMLSDLVSNDEVIQGYDPHEVTNAYNEIVQTSPHLADQYSVMRSALRSRLTSGQMQPFEVAQLRDIDKSLVPPPPKV